MPRELSTANAPSPCVLPMEAGCTAKPHAAWVRWVLPSIADVFVLVLVILLTYTPMGSALLGDADTGWHIRNGEIILATHSVPRTDSFSYTRAGQPWYSWEWLYDAIVGAIHHVSGLNGIVLFSAVIIACTFALLFHFLLRRSGNFLMAAALALLAAASAQIHMLARPHIFSWLLTLLWVEVLYRFDEGKRSALLCLPPLMLLWVNIHGGFILGLVLLAMLGCSRIWGYISAPNRALRRQMSELALTFAVCLAVTFVTPYGYKLHVHVYQYLSNDFLMNTINEFMSPNFHAAGYGYFECFILICVFGVMLARDRITVFDLLVVLFSIHAGLLAARNIPISVILVSLAVGPKLTGASPFAPARECPQWGRSIMDAVRAVSRGMGQMEKQFCGHALTIALLAGSAAIAVNGGRILSLQIVSAHFDDKVFPVKATEFIAQNHIHDHLFNTDDWSGYLIYKLYPNTRLYFDDRHDFYGESFIREYLKAASGGWEWREPLERYQIRWVLVPANSPLSSLLKQSHEWRVAYDDGLAIIFDRR